MAGENTSLAYSPIIIMNNSATGVYGVLSDSPVCHRCVLGLAPLWSAVVSRILGETIGVQHFSFFAIIMYNSLSRMTG
jgi:hypothetical protein